jgi:hypothetical protein
VIAPDVTCEPNDPVPILARVAIALVSVAVVVVFVVGYVKVTTVEPLRDHRARNEAENHCAGTEGVRSTLHALLPVLLEPQPNRTPAATAAEITRITDRAVAEFDAAYKPCTFMESGKKAPLRRTLGGPHQ